MKDLFYVDIEVTEGSGKKKPQYSLQSDINGEMTLADLLDFTKSTLIITSDEVLKEELAKGFDKDFITVVDGKTSTNVAAVHPLGSIQFISQKNMEEVLKFIYEGITERSPVRTGRYASSNYVFFNGRQIATTTDQLLSWIKSSGEVDKPGVFRFVNIQPYARKLERMGVTKGRTKPRQTLSRDKKKKALGMKIAAPNGTYYLAAKAAKSKFKFNFRINFGFIPGAAMGLKDKFKTGIKRGRKARTYLYPTISIYVGGGAA